MGGKKKYKCTDIPKPCSTGCLEYISGQCVKYTGPYLNKLGINSGTTLNEALQIINNLIDVDTSDKEASGTAIFSGDGITTVFSIPHTLIGVPDYSITPASPAASGITYTEATAITLVVHFDVAPPIGTDNIIIKWEARLQ